MSQKYYLSTSLQHEHSADEEIKVYNCIYIFSTYFELSDNLCFYFYFAVNKLYIICHEPNPTCT